jgi:hypothetical protein
VGEDSLLKRVMTAAEERQLCGEPRSGFIRSAWLFAASMTMWKHNLFCFGRK